MQGDLEKKLLCLSGGWQQERHRGTTKESSAQTVLWNGQAAHTFLKSTPATAPSPVVCPLLCGCQSRRWTCRNQFNLPQTSNLPTRQLQSFCCEWKQCCLWRAPFSFAARLPSSPMGRTWDRNQWGDPIVTFHDPARAVTEPKLQRAPWTGSYALLHPAQLPEHTALGDSLTGHSMGTPVVSHRSILQKPTICPHVVPTKVCKHPDREQD